MRDFALYWTARTVSFLGDGVMCHFPKLQEAVLAAVRNIDEFYRTFDVTPADALWLDPSQRVTIW